ncbi:MAG: hypothetical protein K5656_12235 [Lachnospiraceae bacterium]|nr:hypothetical protein [Lachnospiraceae bacterium]
MKIKTTDEYEADYKHESLDTYIKNRRNRVFKILIIIIILGIVGSFAWRYVVIDNGAKKALREAKDVRIGISMLAVENYSKKESLYDVTSSTGMTEGSEAKVLEVSNADGHITVLSWDAENNAPTAFIYEKDQYIVHYNSKSEDEIWKVFYTYQVLGY